MARVHATFQFTGDCPGFYMADNLEPMKDVLKEYSPIIYDYNMKSNRTMRESFGSVNFSQCHTVFEEKYKHKDNFSNDQYTLGFLTLSCWVRFPLFGREDS